MAAALKGPSEVRMFYALKGVSEVLGTALVAWWIGALRVSWEDAILL
jgi:hypothetical protein